MRKFLSNKRGFSLIELIVVIAILGVLIGVAAPQLIGYIEKTRVSKDISNVEVVKRSAEAYVASKLPGGVSEGDITDEVAAESFGGELPKLQSNAGKTANGNSEDITVELVDETTGEVSVSPTADEIKAAAEGGSAAPTTSPE